MSKRQKRPDAEVPVSGRLEVLSEQLLHASMELNRMVDELRKADERSHEHE